MPPVWQILDPPLYHDIVANLVQIYMYGHVTRLHDNCQTVCIIAIVSCVLSFWSSLYGRTQTHTPLHTPCRWCDIDYFVSTVLIILSLDIMISWVHISYVSSHHALHNISCPLRVTLYQSSLFQPSLDTRRSRIQY